MDLVGELTRPRLKSDVYWVPNPDGATFLHTGGHLNVGGRSAVALMDKLEPYLDGTATLGELLAGLPDGKRDMVTTLVGALLRAGLAKDAADDEPHGLSADELALYADEIAYIDYYLDSAARRFQTYRETRLLCIGSGLTFTALVHSCLAAGARRVVALVTTECRTDLARLGEYARMAAVRDPRQTLDVTVVDTPTSGPLAAAVRSAGAVLHLGDQAMPARARQLDEICRELGRPLVHGVVVGDDALTGPVTGEPGTAWTSAWLRRAGNLASHSTGGDPFAPVDRSQREPGPFLAGPTAAVVANRVSFLAFRHLTGVAAADKRAADPAGAGRTAVNRVNLETLQTSEHRFLPHPGAARAVEETEEEFVERYRGFLAAVASDPAVFSTAAARCFDRELGLFSEIDEEAMPQLPLYVARARVSDPFGWLGARGPAGDGDPRTEERYVVGVGDTLAAARHETAVAALSMYAALAVDERRLPGDGQAFAHNLVLDKVELIPAVRAYPALDTTLTAPFRVPIGLVSGEDAADALARGLRAHVVALTASAVGSADAPFPRVDLDGASLDEHADRYRRMLRLAQVPLTVYDVTCSLGVGVYALCVGDRTVGFTAAAELAAGLRRVLLDYQGVRPGSGHPTVELPARLRGDRTVPLRADAPSWHELAQTLAEHGYQTHAVPAGHDPVVTDVLPTLVQVVVDV